jgi:hypothetical protein
MLLGMSSRATVDVQFRLSAPALPGGAEVRLRSFGERWVAVARIDGMSRSGLGIGPRQALSASLADLPASTTTVLLADLALLHPSVEIAR